MDVHDVIHSLTPVCPAQYPVYCGRRGTVLSVSQLGLGLSRRNPISEEIEFTST